MAPGDCVTFALSFVFSSTCSISCSSATIDKSDVDSVRGTVTSPGNLLTCGDCNRGPRILALAPDLALDAGSTPNTICTALTHSSRLSCFLRSHICFGFVHLPTCASCCSTHTLGRTSGLVYAFTR